MKPRCLVQAPAHETDEELVWLQKLIDRTFEHANPHLTAIVSPQRRLTARQIAAYLQGTKHVAFAIRFQRARRAAIRN